MKNNKAVIIDFKADKTIINELKRLGCTVIPSMKNTKVSVNLSGHPDLQICKCARDVYICSPDSYEYYSDILSGFNVKIIKGITELGSNYPEDIAYNVAWIGNKAIHNFSHTDIKIREYFNANNVKMINVSQGYSKCNICVVNYNAVITSDRGIYNELIKNEVDVLLICQQHIDIFGWEYGFIGGASGKIDADTLAFCGDICTHPDYEAINSFCLAHNVNCISLSNKRLMDLGSLVLVENLSV